MGIRSSLADWYRRANESFGRHGIILALLFWIVVPGAVAGGMIALALQLSWFWITFRWFGVAMVGLLSWAIVGLGIAAYRSGTKPRPKPQEIEAKSGINWRPWRDREEYSLYEFAKILAKTDPAQQELTSEGSSYARLLLESTEKKKLNFIPEWRMGVERRYMAKPDYNTKISREDALAWARERSYPIDHIA